jgi:hypothetical protein
VDVSGGACQCKNRGHPLAARHPLAGPVTHWPAPSIGTNAILRTIPHFFIQSLYSHSPKPLHNLVFEFWLRHCAPVTHQDQGLRALRCSAPGCVGSPRKPSVPHRVQFTRPIESVAQIYGFARVRSNPSWLTVRAQRTPRPGRDRRRRAIRSPGFKPTPKRHCRRRPIEPSIFHRFIHPKALDTSKGLPSFMTWWHARASLCATALMATTASVLAHFF